MDNENDELKQKSRRNFFKDLGLVGLGGFAFGASLYSAKLYEDKKKGNALKLLTVDGRVVEVDELLIKDVDKELLADLQQRGREGIPGKSWVMVIDLAKCRNARQCVTACQSAHELRPEQYHINTLQMQDTEHTAPYHMPKPCQHCDNPPCVSVCPVDATFKRNDGIVLIDNDRCIGCRFCIAACPYSARTFHWFEPKEAEREEKLAYDVELNVPQKKGTISKCLFSADKLRKGELPYCVTACPNSVFWFGDANEDAVTNGTTKQTVRLSELLKDNGAFQLMVDLGTKPRVFYLPPKNRLFPFEDSSEPKHT